MPLLNELREGELAIIESVDGTDSIAMRLMEMGLLPEEPIEMIGRAPLGDPLEYRVSGCQISLRKVEASRVSVRLSTQ
ncbi:ferrous iron transport protein A [uncultured Rubinisphaera sp.]|uniref:FeoA family protein n=1 Tax=uncultured Rubinisphaera sp. TaxID=1678686 RepID=UPI0030DB9229|tara:strand:+ start:787 stop:1020 length:234 start_codon:yes stop_codon:yes gene_type:complete